jgi:hypothetical protein
LAWLFDAIEACDGVVERELVVACAYLTWLTVVDIVIRASALVQTSCWAILIAVFAALLMYADSRKLISRVPSLLLSLLQVDFGTQIDGRIIDCAWTVA